MTEPRVPDLARARRAASIAELRMRLRRVVAVFPYAAIAALALAVVPVALRKVAPERLSEAHARLILMGLAALALLTLLVTALRRLPPRAGTMALDKHHKLSDRLTSALAFLALPEAKRTALMEVAIEDAAACEKDLSPAKAVPIPVPPELGVAALVGLVFTGFALLEVQTVIEEAEVPQIHALELPDDDLELFRDVLKDMAKDGQSKEVQSAIERFNQLVEDIAQKRLDRDEAFRRMEALEREMLDGAEADRKAFEEAMKQLSTDLSQSELAKELSKSLAQKDLEKAEKDMQDLAKTLRDPKKKKDKAAIDRLRQALERASKSRKEALEAINEKRAELREDLLKKKQKQRDPDAGAPDPEEERLLRKKERELERLDREAEQKERTGRQLDRLDRELAKAAEDLLKDLGLSADDLEQAAEDLNRMQEEAMTDQQKEELRQRLQELRELMRQQGQGGRERLARMMRFGKRARGNQGQGQKGQGQPQPGQGQEPGEGQEGQGQEGQGQEGQGPGQGEGQMVLGPDGKPMLLLQKGSGASGQGQSGEGDQPGGREAGKGHDGNLKGDRTDPKLGTQDVEAQGLDSGQGASNSQVILSAAEKGFRGGGYKKVYTDYRTVAEDELDKETVPDGYRFYVRRYFQLIRPRE